MDGEITFVPPEFSRRQEDDPAIRRHVVELPEDQTLHITLTDWSQRSNIKAYRGTVFPEVSGYLNFTSVHLHDERSFIAESLTVLQDIGDQLDLAADIDPASLRWQFNGRLPTGGPGVLFATTEQLRTMLTCVLVPREMELHQQLQRAALELGILASLRNEHAADRAQKAYRIQLVNELLPQGYCFVVQQRRGATQFDPKKTWMRRQGIELLNGEAQLAIGTEFTLDRAGGIAIKRNPKLTPCTCDCYSEQYGSFSIMAIDDVRAPDYFDLLQRAHRLCALATQD